MSATNSTPIINLPLFIGTDKPAWLTDWNGAMNTIDTAIANLQTAESGTATSLASLAQSVEALSGTVSQHTTAIQTVTTATAGNTGSINTINSLIGNGVPTTDDKTIIGAINEIYGKIGGGDGIDADEVNYDNTTSGLTATDVQAAIDEVNAKIPAGGAVEADDVVYDNQTSGLTATNVQAAIDELAQGGGAGTSFTVTADGVKTYGQLLADLDALIGSTALTKKSCIVVDNAGDFSVYKLDANESASKRFGYIYVASSSALFVTLDLKAHNASSVTLTASATTFSDTSSSVINAGRTITLYV